MGVREGALSSNPGKVVSLAKVCGNLMSYFLVTFVEE